MVRNKRFYFSENVGYQEQSLKAKILDAGGFIIERKENAKSADYVIYSYYSMFSPEDVLFTASAADPCEYISVEELEEMLREAESQIKLLAD